MARKKKMTAFKKNAVVFEVKRRRVLKKRLVMFLYSCETVKLKLQCSIHR